MDTAIFLENFYEEQNSAEVVVVVDVLLSEFVYVHKSSLHDIAKLMANGWSSEVA